MADPVKLANLVDGTADATDTGDTTVIAAPGVATNLYITTLIICNTSATATYVLIKSGSTTRLRIPAPANNGGAVISLPTPLALGTNEALKFASGQSVSTMTVSAIGYKG